MTSPDLTYVCRSTSEALRDVLDAVLEADQQAARRALRRSTIRHHACTVLREQVRIANIAKRTPDVDDVQLVDCLRRVNCLLDKLAEQVVAAADCATKEAELRSELLALREAGTRRLHQLGEAPLTAPNLDPEYRRCGIPLREMTHRWTPDRSPTRVLCSAIASTLLQASTHASHPRPESNRAPVPSLGDDNGGRRLTDRT